MSSLIGLSYKKILKPLLFRRDPEFVHDKFTSVGKLMGRTWLAKLITRFMFRYDHPMLEQEVAGMKFKNPVGLSAGFDKDANLSEILKEVGFGFENIGSVTWKPYKGNPKPRLYRLPKSKGLIVYYGLKNIGIKKIAAKIKNIHLTDFPLGISIAKTNSDETCTTESGIEDYYQCLDYSESQGVGDFYTINISCPNTFGGEPYTTPKKLDALLRKLVTVKTKKPILVKMPINLEWQEFRKLLDVIVRYKLQGVIIGNLNKDRTRKEIQDVIPEGIPGGISGKSTWELSNNLISKTYQEYQGQLVIVGVGGIFSAKDAYEKIKRGSSLVQLITGMIYEGPQLIGEINRGLVELMKRDGYSKISDAVGTGVSTSTANN